MHTHMNTSTCSGALTCTLGGIAPSRLWFPKSSSPGLTGIGATLMSCCSWGLECFLFETSCPCPIPPSDLEKQMFSSPPSPVPLVSSSSSSHFCIHFTFLLTYSLSVLSLFVSGSFLFSSSTLLQTSHSISLSVRRLLARERLLSPCWQFESIISGYTMCLESKMAYNFLQLEVLQSASRCILPPPPASYVHFPFPPLSFRLSLNMLKKNQTTSAMSYSILQFLNTFRFPSFCPINPSPPPLSSRCVKEPLLNVWKEQKENLAE